MKLLPFHFGLRAKVLLVSLVLLAIPWAGHLYVKEMEKFLREAQESILTGTARAVATSLQDRSQLFEFKSDSKEIIDPTKEEIVMLAPAVTSPSEVDSEIQEEISLIIKGLNRPATRIWVVDRRLRIIAVAGSLKTEPVTETRPVTTRGDPLDPLERFEQTFLHPIYSKILTPPSDDFMEVAPDAEHNYSKEIGEALNGILTIKRWPTPDNRAVIVSSTHPIWAGDRIVGAVVVEETANAIQTLSNRALEKLMTITLVVFLLGALPLFIFASRLSFRVRQLRDEAEQAIDSRGRVQGIVTSSEAKDEIGDLSRSFSDLLERLRQYNDYLENMASRLSHELRTPIAVVRSSLDNLKMQAANSESKIYMTRAEEGLSRLSIILTRMSEAARLEQSLGHAEKEKFDVCKVVSGCIEGYKSAYPQHTFHAELPDNSLFLVGAPDLIAQMLDKLVSNAMDFGKANQPIIVRLTREQDWAVLRIINAGSPLPQEMQQQLFQSMVSIRRQGASAEPHLGLGLFIVRLIIEFHEGTVSASNREDTEGVVITIKLPITE